MASTVKVEAPDAPPETFYIALTNEQIRFLVDTDPDFVNSKRYDYSLKKLLEAHPDGCGDRLAAIALAMTETELEEEYQAVLKKIRLLMGVDSL